MTRCDEDGFGPDGQHKAGAARNGDAKWGDTGRRMARLGATRQERNGKAWADQEGHGDEWFDGVRQAWPDSLGNGLSRPGWAAFGNARQARIGSAWLGTF